jgi:hypothetical protein
MTSHLAAWPIKGFSDSIMAICPTTSRWPLSFHRGYSNSGSNPSGDSAVDQRNERELPVNAIAKLIAQFEAEAGGKKFRLVLPKTEAPNPLVLRIDNSAKLK